MQPTQRLVAGSLLIVVGCGGGGGDGVDPDEVRFGDTALVVVVNPAINDGNAEDVPAPGSARAGIRLASDDGLVATTDAAGIAVLAPLAAGARTIEVTGDGVEASFTVTLGDGELRELALSAAGTTAQIMVELDYTSARAVELAATSTIAEVNAALAVSDTVVFVRGGSYTGDLDFAGSRVTLFGEGVLGGQVTIDGNVTISGSDSRIRGATITGTLEIPASGTGLSFSRVDGAVTAEGSDTTLLANALCGSASITGSGAIVVGNAGLAPTPSCP